jgi:hypothetical protein
VADADGIVGAVLDLLDRAELFGSDQPGNVPGAVRAELAEILGDVSEPVPMGDHRRAAPGTESELAARLAQEHHGDCWTVFAQERVAESLAQRALDLYRYTTAWLDCLQDTPAQPAAAAAELLRHIGDGFAMLSQPHGGGPLPLPLRAWMETAIRALGVDAWAAGLGHRLEVDVASADDQLAHHQHPGTEDRDADRQLAPAAIGAISQYELLELLCDSRAGRTALRTEPLRRFAVARIVTARRWEDWIRVPCEGVVGAAMLRVGQAWFVACYGEIASSALLYPDRRQLGAFLRQEDADLWLADAVTEVPDWLARRR